MGISGSRYRFFKCVPVDDEIKPLFACCAKEVELAPLSKREGNHITRYRLLYKVDDDMLYVTMSFCLLKERKALYGDKVVSDPYSEDEIEYKLRYLVKSYLNWPFPVVSCWEWREPNFVIILHHDWQYMHWEDEIDSEEEESEVQDKIERDDVTIFLESCMYPKDNVFHMISEIHSRFNQWAKETKNSPPITLNAFSRILRKKEPQFMCGKKEKGSVLLHYEFRLDQEKK
jgi:hypothetical protein